MSGRPAYRPRLSQHFLHDRHVIQTILRAAELDFDDTVLEIGPGRGILTERLAAEAKKLVAVELDRTLAAQLQARFRDPRVQILQNDFLKCDLDTLFPEATPEHPIKILGNLPYAITSPIFEKFLPWSGWSSGVFLIQREVGDRILAQAGSKTFGILSLAVQLFAEPKKVGLVKPGSFRPPPNVMSMILRLQRRTALPLGAESIPAFFDLAHAAFAHRRKTLANSLALFTQAPKARVEAWLSQHAIAPQRRAETLALADYVYLAGPWAIFRREIDLT